MKSTFVAVSLVTALGTVSGAAQAQARPDPELTPAVEQEQPRPAPTTWYGWQTLTVDAASLLTASIGAIADDRSGFSAIAAGGALVGYAIGGPAVHWAHARVGTGFASLGIRAGAPLGGGFTGALAGIALGAIVYPQSEQGSVYLGLYGAMGGVVLGSAAAVVIDSVVLAREPAAAPGDSATRIRWTPTGGYDPQRHAANVGLSGAF